MLRDGVALLLRRERVEAVGRRVPEEEREVKADDHGAILRRRRATQLASTFEVSLFLQRLTIASPAYEPIYFRYPRDRESLPRSSAAGFEHPAAIWVDFGTVLRGSALGDAPPSTVFHAVPLHRLTASPSDLDVSDVFLDHADQMRLRSARGELLVASTCRKMRPERRRF